METQKNILEAYSTHSLENLLGSDVFICTNKGLEGCILTLENNKFCIFGYHPRGVDKNTQFNLKWLEECVNITDIEKLNKIKELNLEKSLIENLVNFVKQDKSYEESYIKMTNQHSTSLCYDERMLYTYYW